MSPRLRWLERRREQRDLRALHRAIAAAPTPATQQELLVRGGFQPPHFTR